jgi:hypothetical protein
MQEILLNLHMHTPYSDGYYSHKRIAEAAITAGLDAVIVTDHNVLVDGHEGYYQDGTKRVLLLVGEEIHDQARDPQKNHLLVFGAGKDLATYAADPQRLLDAVRQAGGLAFIAHMVDPAAPAVGEEDISWVSWDAIGYTGVELWNHFSEFKGRLKTKLHAIYYAFNPRRFSQGPFPTALHKWDELLAEGRRVVAVGGSDAHGLPASLGPLHRTLFPYEFHFQSVNNHLLIETPLKGDLFEDRRLILDALRQGRSFIGYDLPAPTRGFRFTAQCGNGLAQMGEEITAGPGVTFQVRLPLRTECRLLKNGEVIKTWQTKDLCTYITSEPGVYRVEVYIHYMGRRRGWIFSNPIYVR